MSHLQYFAYDGFGKRVQKDVNYSPAVRIGDMIEISGQGGWDRITEDISPVLSEEFEQAFKNVEKALQVAGGKGWEQVYKVYAYFAPVSPEALEVFIKLFKEYCPTHQPLLTAYGVGALALDKMHIEIEVAAHLGS